MAACQGLLRRCAVILNQRLASSEASRIAFGEGVELLTDPLGFLLAARDGSDHRDRWLRPND